MKRKTAESEFEFGIYEVYYNEDGSVKGYTENSLIPVVDNPEGLKQELEIMLKAFDQEILDFKE
jgi:hypothetical protein